MTSKMRSRYLIDHLQKVMPDVIAANGAPSGHWTSYKLPVFLVIYQLFVYDLWMLKQILRLLIANTALVYNKHSR